MSKLVTFTNLLPPTNLSGSVVSGGTLATGSTYFYVVQSCFDAGTSPLSTNGRSQSSNQISASVSVSGSQSVQLFWTASSGAGGYRVYRATSSGSYIQMLNSAVRASVNCSGGTCSFIDTGIGNPGNSFYQNVVRGKLDISGSTSVNPFSIVDLFNSSSINGWGVVERLDDDTYSVNTHIIGATNTFWSDIDKVIIFKDGLNPGTNSSYTFGEKPTSVLTRRGCRLVFKTPDLFGLSFSTLFAYKTTFDYVFPNFHSYNQLSVQNVTYNSGSVEYCLINKMRAFQPQNKTNCNMSNTTITEADVALGAGLGTFTNVTGMGNSRVFQTTNDTQITASNVTIVGGTGTLMLGTNFNIKYINSDRVSPTDGIFNASSQGITQDVFTYDLKVLDTNGSAISDANVQLVNVSGSTVFNTTTNATGSIAQQEVLLLRRNIVNNTGPTENLSPYTLTVFKNGYNEYKEVTIYSSSIALNKTIALTETGSIITINLL